MFRLQLRQANDTHGDPNHITLAMVENAAKASQTNAKTVVARIQQVSSQAG